MLDIRHYITEDDKNPFVEWASNLDKIARARVMQRIDRIATGNLGDYKRIKGTDGVFEARLDFGPGYRLYFLREGSKIIVLLCGGDKSTQDRDIEQAEKYANDYFLRTK